MSLARFLPSIHFAISQLQDGSEDAQTHSFYLSKLAEELTPTVVESTPENRQDRVRRLFVENGVHGATTPEKRVANPMWELKSPDDRNTIAIERNGVYYVQKKQIIKEFRFGDLTCKTGAEAHAEMSEFLASRKDADELFVNLMEFKR